MHKQFHSRADRLKTLINIGAFVFLAEAWVTYVPEFYSIHISRLLYALPEILHLNYDWLWLAEQLGLAVTHTLMWVLPYRFLGFLNPSKTIPYLYVLSIGTVVLLFIDLRGFDTASWDEYSGWQEIRLVLVYLLPTMIFHKYFSVLQKNGVKRSNSSKYMFGFFKSKEDLIGDKVGFFIWRQLLSAKIIKSHALPTPQAEVFFAGYLQTIISGYAEAVGYIGDWPLGEMSKKYVCETVWSNKLWEIYQRGESMSEVEGTDIRNLSEAYRKGKRAGLNDSKLEEFEANSLFLYLTGEGADIQAS